MLDNLTPVLGGVYKDTASSLACYQLALQQIAVEQQPKLELVPKVCVCE